MRKAKGLSLSELLVSLFIASLILAALMQLYLHMQTYFSKITQNIGDSLSYQLVISLLENSIHHAGFTPCGGLSHLSILDTRNPLNIPKSLSIDKNTIAVDRMDENFSLSKVLDSHRVQVQRNPYFVETQNIILSNCEKAEIHTIVKIQETTTNYRALILSAATHFSINEKIFVGEWLEEKFILKDKVLSYYLTHGEKLAERISNFLMRQLQSNPDIWELTLLGEKFGPIIVKIGPRTP
jgi:hypothetical protein